MVWWPAASPGKCNSASVSVSDATGRTFGPAYLEDSMRLRHPSLVLALGLLSTFTLSAQNGQNGYWSHTGQIHEKLYVNSGEADTNNLTIFDVKTMTIIKKMTTGKHPHGVASPKTQDVLYIASETEGTVTKLDTVKDEIIEVYGGWGTEPQESDITPDGRF